ncbi:FtsW/RodA/SpoVE family cell cycle protein [Salininema proteolyticum]|uniref:FtsW/RodA/SpoVE family cell cycle protein n=1 Tax=Salininema proteolyticum TaxID=1607685 RepID=A0ABV8TVJ5_9ACTN
MNQAVSARAKAKGGELPLTPVKGMPLRTSRGAVMLVVAMACVAVFEIAVETAVHGEMGSQTWVFTGAACAAMAGAWGLSRWLAPYADQLIVLAAAILTGLGVVFQRRLTLTDFNDPLPADAGPFADAGGRQLIFALVGIAFFALVLMLFKDFRTLRGYAYILGFGGVILAALPGLLPSSISERNGAKNWIIVGPVSVQPSEFAKIALLVFFAYYLYRHRDVLSVAGKKAMGIQFPRLRDFGPIIIMWVASMGILVLENDLGSSLLFFGLFMAMLYTATRRVSWIIIGLLLFVGGCVAIYPFFEHLQLRVQIWLDPFNPAYVNDQSYQLVQGLIGLGSGGLIGAGPGGGEPNIIPFAESDFILAALGEEIGLAGLIAVFLLYGILVERAFKTGVMQRDGFGKLVVAGLGFSFAFQIFVVAGGVSGLIPLTGLNTPFLAAGGSSMLASWIMIALLVRISDDARRPWNPSFGLQKIQPPPEWFAAHGDRPVAGVREEADMAPAGDQETQLILAQETGQIVSEDVSPVTAEPDVVDEPDDEEEK